MKKIEKKKQQKNSNFFFLAQNMFLDQNLLFLLCRQNIFDIIYFYYKRLVLVFSKIYKKKI